MMGKKYLAGALLLLLPWLLSACMLLPTEEEARTAPLISTYTKTAYQTEQVKRETLIEEKNITCRYVPVQSVGLSFGVGGEYIDEVLVQLGDSVQEGQILAYLNLEDMLEKIDAAKDALEETALRIRHLDALEEVAMRRCILEQEGKAESVLAAALEKVQKEYAKKRQDFLDTQTLQNFTLSALNADMEKRRITAPFDGTVTYVRKYDEGAMSSLGERVITLADATLSLFRAETQYWEYFVPGDLWEITVSKEVYSAVVTDEESLGLEKQEKIPGKSAYVYFKLTEPNFELEEGDTGKINLVLNTRENVLTLSEKAVSAIGDRPIVYYLKEDGTKGYKFVETGVTIKKRVEIISGVEADEIVVVD